MRISDLILKHIAGTITAEEKEELLSWVAEDPEHERLFKDLTDLRKLREKHLRYSIVDTERPKADGQRRIDQLLSASVPRRRRPVAAYLWTAATVAAVIGIGAWWLATDSLTSQQPAKPALAQIERLDDIKPGQMVATLTSSSGKAVVLNAADSIAVEAIVEEPEHRRDLTELCLDVPRGGEFKIILEDSTVVYLNSESTLRYPETFSASNRRVQLTGEAYFEVKKDPTRPFLVESEGQTVRVLGTTFNIKAYPDDNITYTTLETGSIALYNPGHDSGELIISPGHQAMLNREEKAIDTKTVRTDVVTSWRHGRFVFQDLPLSKIMRDLSRWYDFEYEFTDPSVGDIVFIGSIPRYGDFVTAVAILEESGGIKFDISNNKILISRKGKRK